MRDCVDHKCRKDSHSSKSGEFLKDNEDNNDKEGVLNR